jgi:hypothetical protein
MGILSNWQMKYIFLILAVLFSTLTYGQKKPSREFTIFGVSVTMGDRNGRIVDSSLGYHYWKHNYKYVPAKGYYRDTIRDDKDGIYETCTFYNQYLISFTRCIVPQDGSMPALERWDAPKKKNVIHKDNVTIETNTPNSPAIYAPNGNVKINYR